MATAEQLRALIQAHFSEDTERFNTSALQIAAHEASTGHGALAHELRLIVDTGRRAQGAAITKFPQDMRGMVVAEEPDVALGQPNASERRFHDRRVLLVVREDVPDAARRGQ